jgi:hypothetical protein
MSPECETPHGHGHGHGHDHGHDTVLKTTQPIKEREIATLSTKML